MLDFSQPFTLEADASGFGVGVVLLQHGHPITYYSKLLGPRARAQSIYEKALMVVVLAVQKWKHYLLGRHFVMHSDQQSLRYLMEQREVGTEYQRWMSKLLGYDFEIKYKPGPFNRVADALSRQYSSHMECSNLITVHSALWEDMQQHITTDDFIIQMKQKWEKKVRNCLTDIWWTKGSLGSKGALSYLVIQA